MGVDEVVDGEQQHLAHEIFLFASLPLCSRRCCRRLTATCTGGPQQHSNAGGPNVIFSKLGGGGGGGKVAWSSGEAPIAVRRM